MVRAHYPGSFLGHYANVFQSFQDSYKTMAGKRRRSITNTAAYKRPKFSDHYDNKSKGGGPSTVNMLAQKVAMKRTGSSKVKSIVGRKKTVKVSRQLREKIKKVVKAEDGYGVYHTTRQGSIGIQNHAADSSRVTIDQGGYPAEIIQITQGFEEERGDSRNWTQGLITNLGFTQGDEYQFFTPLKFLDAASVLWNQKAATKNYAIQAGNFTNSVALGVGAPVAGTPALPNKKGVDVHVVNSYVTFEMKNNSQRILSLELYHCVPKVKWPSNLPLGTFNGGIIELGQTQLQLGTIICEENTDTLDALIFNPNLKPKSVDAFSSAYKYEKVTISIAPGETCKHSIQGPKGLDIEFSKLYDGLVDNGGKMWSKSSLCVMIAIKPDLIYATKNVGTLGGTGTGRYTAQEASGNTLKDMVSVEVKEVFKMSMPDDTGFVLQEIGAGGIPAGSIQSLNLKRKVLAFGNFTSKKVNAGGDGIAYGAFDEENPVIVIPASATN